MHQELPIACSLDGPELTARIAEIGAIGRDALLSVEAKPGGTLLRFTAGRCTRKRLEQIVEAEARCCPFLKLDLHDETEMLALTIHAPPGAEALAGELASAFQPPKSQPEAWDSHTL